MKNMERVIFGSILLIGLGFSLQTQACTTTGWADSSNIPGSGEAGSPTTVSRYSEFCALEVTGTSYVQSNAASDTRYIGRFYFLPKTSGAGTVDILIAYSDQAVTDNSNLMQLKPAVALPALLLPAAGTWLNLNTIQTAATSTTG